MFLDWLNELPGNIPDLLYLSDSTFYHLLGLVTLIGFLRIFIPLHCIMTSELQRRNEIADLAEENHCSEFDIFVKAHKFYFGSDHPDRTKQDFITYLNNWPDNYILPFYIRNFLAELERDDSDSRQYLLGDKGNKISENLSNITIN
ncbi:MAG: hypothetical protein JRF02_04450 [Deltaproteobacteria bacterium]|jgi:hypothetical protein|nr:hypothetical protein [Deltaproteobacteria bacterium]